jgi:hypothetical protein
MGFSGSQRLIFVAAALLAAGACSAKEESTTASGSPGGSGQGPGSGSSGDGGGGGSGGGSGGSGTGGSGDASGPATSPPDDDFCNMIDFKFEPKIPTVIVLVDRSGSMYDCISTSGAVEPSCMNPADTTWTKLKEGILPVVQQLQATVRFGFNTITGSNPSAGGMCPIPTSVTPKLDNYDAIATLYNSLPAAPNSTQSGMKWETPTRQLLEAVGTELAGDTAPGDKYILFVTDGEPDYCGDGNSLCPPDGVVWQLQKLKAEKNITTIVFGLKATIAQDLPAGVLEAFANAGAGEPTLPPLRGTNPKIEDFYDQCWNMSAAMNVPNDAQGGWSKDFISTGKPMMRGQTLGTYSAAAGPTKPYMPDVNNQQQLINVLSAALSGVKSCIFDLKAADGTPIVVNLDSLDRARVQIETTNVPLVVGGATEGWRMNSPTQLELVGSACTDWRKPQNDDIGFDFPCGTVVLL